jgi:hypothetical protein
MHSRKSGLYQCHHRMVHIITSGVEEVPQPKIGLSYLMEYITLRLDSTNEVEQWYIRHNCFIVLYHRLHVSTYIQVILRPSFTGKSIKCYTCWDPIMLTEVKYIKT